MFDLDMIQTLFAAGVPDLKPGGDAPGTGGLTKLGNALALYALIAAGLAAMVGAIQLAVGSSSNNAMFSASARRWVGGAFIACAGVALLPTLLNWFYGLF